MMMMMMIMMMMKQNNGDGWYEPIPDKPSRTQVQIYTNSHMESTKTIVIRNKQKEIRARSQKNRQL